MISRRTLFCFSELSGNRFCVSFTRVTPWSAHSFAHASCFSHLRISSASDPGTKVPSAFFCGSFIAAFVARIRFTTSSSLSSERIPFLYPSAMYCISSSIFLLNRMTSQPFSIQSGTAFFLSSALQNPTIGVASVVISPLNPSFSRRRCFIRFLDNVAGMILSHGFLSKYSSYAGIAICAAITVRVPASIISS